MKKIFFSFFIFAFLFFFFKTPTAFGSNVCCNAACGALSQQCPTIVGNLACNLVCTPACNTAIATTNITYDAFCSTVSFSICNIVGIPMLGINLQRFWPACTNTMKLVCITSNSVQTACTNINPKPTPTLTPTPQPCSSLGGACQPNNSKCTLGTIDNADCGANSVLVCCRQPLLPCANLGGECQYTSGGTGCSYGTLNGACDSPDYMQCCAPQSKCAVQIKGAQCYSSSCASNKLSPASGSDGYDTSLCSNSEPYCCKAANSVTPTPDGSVTGSDCYKRTDTTCVYRGNTNNTTDANKAACQQAKQGDPQGYSCNTAPNQTNDWTCCSKANVTPTGTGGGPGQGNGNPSPTPSCGTDTQYKDGTCNTTCNGDTYSNATCNGSDKCCQPDSNGFRGHLDATTTTFSGWACQPYNSYKSLIKVNFYTDANKTNLLGSITANQSSDKDPNVPPSATECGGTDNPNSGDHSFSFNPNTLAQWNPNNIPSQIYAFGVNAVNGNEEPFTSNPATLSSGSGGGGGTPTITITPTGTGGGGGNGSPTPTGGPTPTPNLTPEPAVANVSLQVDSIDAIDAATQKVPFSKKRHLTLYLYTDTTYQTDPLGKKATYKTTGDIYFTTGDPNTPSTYGTYVNAQFPLGTIPSGDYYIFGQTEGSLREPLTDTPQTTTINNGIVNSLTFSQKLPMGLLHIGQPYNTVSVLDFNDIVSCYGDKMSGGDCVGLGLNDDIFTSVPFADFDMDGVVDGTDYNIWARNSGRTGL